MAAAELYFNIDVRPVSRNTGGSSVSAAAYRAADCLSEDMSRNFSPAVAHAAYIAGEALTPERGTGTVHDYRPRTKNVLGSKIFLPVGAPEWMADRASLWNACEASDKRKDARTAVDVRISFVRELSVEGNMRAMHRLVQKHLTSTGHICDVAIHRPKASDGQENGHAHILVASRCVDPFRPLGFAAKKSEMLRARNFVDKMRAAWSAELNRELEAEKVQGRVDHRSLSKQFQEAVDRGDTEAAARLDRKPTRPLGKKAAKLEARGIATPQGDRNRAIREHNAKVQATYAEVGRFGPMARKAFMQIRVQIGCALKAFEQWKQRMREWIVEMRTVFTPSQERSEAVDEKTKPPQVAAAAAQEKQPERGRDETERQSRFQEMAQRATAKMREANRNRGVEIDR